MSHTKPNAVPLETWDFIRWHRLVHPCTTNLNIVNELLALCSQIIALRASAPCFVIYHGLRQVMPCLMTHAVVVIDATFGSWSIILVACCDRYHIVFHDRDMYRCGCQGVRDSLGLYSWGSKHYMQGLIMVPWTMMVYHLMHLLSVVVLDRISSRTCAKPILHRTCTCTWG